MKLTKKAKKGFTLVELVVVIAVIAILAAVSVGAYFGITESAKEAQLKQEAEQIHLAMRVISLKGDPNQTLKREGLYVDNLETFNEQLSYELGWEGLKVVAGDTEPTGVENKLVYLCDKVEVNNETLYTYFHYYTVDALGKKARVNIMGGNEIDVSNSPIELAKHECGVHTVDVSGDHSAAQCGKEGHYICDGKTHEDVSDSCLLGHQCSTECDNCHIPNGMTVTITVGNESTTYSHDDDFNCGELETLVGDDVFEFEASYGDYIYSNRELVVDDLHESDPNREDVIGLISSTSSLELELVVDVKDESKTKESLGKIEDSILGVPVTMLVGTFMDCINLKNAPNIPSYARYCVSTFYECKNMINGPEKIPSTAFLCYSMFYGCTKLVEAPILEEGIEDMYNMFSGCTSLRGNIDLPLSVTNLSCAFEECKGITFGDSTSENILTIHSGLEDISNMLCDSIINSDFTIVFEEDCKLSPLATMMAFSKMKVNGTLNIILNSENVKSWSAFSGVTVTEELIVSGSASSDSKETLIRGHGCEESQIEIKEND